jgi:uncharacterized metal-binding protein YceD (DUF177 family)
MKDLKDFTIPFVGLKLGTHHYDFDIDQKFFAHFEYTDFHHSAIHVDAVLEKKTTLLEFTVTFKGTVNVSCDRTNEPFDLPVSGQYHFVVKFGEHYDDEQDDLLILPHGSYQVNIQQFVYESIVLSLPAKRIHPGIVDGTLDSDVLNKLEKLSLTADQDPEAPEADPRWDNLKKLLTDK